MKALCSCHPGLCLFIDSCTISFTYSSFEFFSPTTQTLHTFTYNWLSHHINSVGSLQTWVTRKKELSWPTKCFSWCTLRWQDHLSFCKLSSLQRSLRMAIMSPSFNETTSEMDLVLLVVTNSCSPFSLRNTVGFRRVPWLHNSVGLLLCTWVQQDPLSACDPDALATFQWSSSDNSLAFLSWASLNMFNTHPSGSQLFSYLWTFVAIWQCYFITPWTLMSLIIIG